MYLRVTLAPTDFHWVNSWTTYPTAETKGIDRDVCSNNPNTKLVSYRGIGEQRTSNKKQPDSYVPRCAALPYQHALVLPSKTECWDRWIIAVTL